MPERPRARRRLITLRFFHLLLSHP